MQPPAFRAVDPDVRPASIALSLVAMAALGCGRESPAGSRSADAKSAPPEVAEVVASAPPPVVEAVVDLELPERGVSIRIPDDWVPISDAEATRLVAAAQARNPGEEIEVVGRKSPAGVTDGLAAVMFGTQADLMRVYGETVRSSVSLLHQETLARIETVAPGGTVSVQPFEDAPYIELLMVLPVPGKGETRTRVRHWATPDGRMFEAGCQCAGPDCSVMVADCVLPQPPRDALALDEPITGGQAPHELSLADGKATVKVAPFFTDVAPEEIAQMEANERARFEQLDRNATAARIGPSEDAGIVFLFDSTWCADDGPGVCKVAEIATTTREVGVLEAKSQGFVPQVSQRIERTSDRELHTWELRMGLNSWERHVLWQEGASVRELACLCGGPACALAERTCTLAPLG